MCDPNLNLRKDLYTNYLLLNLKDMQQQLQQRKNMKTKMIKYSFGKNRNTCVEIIP